MLAEMGIRVWTPMAAPAQQPEETSAARPTAPESLAPPPAVRIAPAPFIRPPATPQPAPVAVTMRDGVAAEAVDPVLSLDWPALREAVAACTACGLCATRTQTVFGVGHPQAHWMVVGEAPGEEEDRRGEPFVGRSGRLLDSMLRAIGLSRHVEPTPADVPAAPVTAVDPSRQVYIANTLKCRPPGNRNPLPDELARCEHFLIRQIELVRPKIILAMGAFAVQSLLRTRAPVGKLRGRVHQYQGVPLVVTYHPAYLLRNLPEKARAWDDLCLALDTVDAAGGG